MTSAANSPTISMIQANNLVRDLRISPTRGRITPFTSSPTRATMPTTISKTAWLGHSVRANHRGKEKYTNLDDRGDHLDDTRNIIDYGAGSVLQDNLGWHPNQDSDIADYVINHHQSLLENEGHILHGNLNRFEGV